MQSLTSLSIPLTLFRLSSWKTTTDPSSIGRTSSSIGKPALTAREKADKEFNSYQYDLYGSSDYSNELDISYFYCNKDDPDSILDLEHMYYSLYVVKIQGMVHDQNMNTCKYIAIPSKEEQEFIDNLLSMSDKEIIDNYEKAKKQLKILTDNYEAKRRNN